VQPAHQDAAALRRILTAYFGVVVESLAGAVPKTVVLHLRAFVQRFQTHLVRALQDAGPASLLVEDETTAAGKGAGLRSARCVARPRRSSCASIEWGSRGEEGGVHVHHTTIV
jgi:hypothetical protein